MLDIDVEDDPPVRTVRLVGDLDASTAGQYREATAYLWPNGHLVIELSRLSFLDSAGLGALIGSIRRAREVGGDVALCCPRPSVARLLATTGFDRMVTVASSADEARSRLAADPAA
ncbi:MAG: STAS domain-containing protein [Actinomycetota bacterium]|nr:STAS domain-containing protein [Actinomycetota bacterium]